MLTQAELVDYCRKAMSEDVRNARTQNHNMIALRNAGGLAVSADFAKQRRDVCMASARLHQRRIARVPAALREAR